MIKRAKEWMGVTAVILGIGLSDTALCESRVEEIRFQGGHPWLSRSRLCACDSLEHQKRAIDRLSSDGKVRIFDITVKMDKVRTAKERKNIEEIFKYFAWGVYEATEGKHKIGIVKIYEKTGISTDISWSTEDKLFTNRPSTTLFIPPINMHDGAGGKSFLISEKQQKIGGFTLAHEWGHYMYGFGEEYDSHDSPASTILPGDTHVQPSLMGASSSKAASDDYRWLNLSIAWDKNGGDFRNTKLTSQHRLYGKSCLEQLVKPVYPKAIPVVEWRLEGNMWEGWKWVAYTKSEQCELYVPPKRKAWYPEFSTLDPTKKPRIDLTATGKVNATNELQVLWMDDPRLMWGICLDHSGSMNALALANAKANAKQTIEKAPVGTLVGIFAFADVVTEILPFTEVTDANRSSLKAKVDAISSGGGTALWKAADAALNRMNAIDPEQNNIGSLLLLTDGEDNASGPITRSYVVAKCQDMGVVFNSISYGNNAEGELGVASRETGGKNISSSDSLTSLNEGFSRLLTHGSSRGTIVDTKGSVPASSVWTESFMVDSSVTNMQTTVALSVPSSSATVVLVSPSGIRYLTNSKTDVGGESSFVFVRSNPIPGSWTVSVTAPSDTAVSCYVDASAFKEPPRLFLWVDDSDTIVYATLTQGAPVDGATIRAILHEDGIIREVPFESTGAGTYQLALKACGAFRDGFTVRADAEKGIAKYTYIGVMGYEGDAEGTPIEEGFTRSEWLDLSRLNEMSVRFVEVHPRWPWEAKIDVDFQVATTDKNTKVSAKLTGIDNRTGDLFALSALTCDDSLADLGVGQHRATWDAAVDLPGQDLDDFSIRFDVTTGTALGAVTGLTASAGTYYDGVHVDWGAVMGATGYRVYRSESSDGTGRVLLATQTGRSYIDATAVAGKKYYYYWVQPIALGTNGTVKHEGVLVASGGGWRGQLGGVSGLSASSGTHYDGVHLSWTGPTGATSFRIYRASTANASARVQIATTMLTYYIDTRAAKLQRYYYYWVEPIAVVSGATYVGAINSSPVSGWRNKLGTPTFHFADWRPGHKDRPEIDLYIDSPVSGATYYEYMSGDKSSRWRDMDAVGDGSSGYAISTVTYGSKATIGWAWDYRYYLHVYVRAANSEGVGDWVKWNLEDHLSESAFKNSTFYKRYPKR